MTSASFSLLYPPLIPYAVKAVEECQMMVSRYGFTAKLGHTYRDRNDQWKLWRKGRWQDNHGRWHRKHDEGIVTRAIPTESPHCVEDDTQTPNSMAFHIKVLVDGGKRFAPDDHEAWACVGAAAFIAGGQEHQLEWGGFWRSIRDCPHIEWRGWRSLVDSRGILL